MRAVVCVPARNEAEVLPNLIRSLERQHGEGRLRLVVLANNCTDGTVPDLYAMMAAGASARIALRLVEAKLSPGEAHVGTARRMALDAGAAWLEEGGVEEDGMPGGVLLSTDADAQAPPDWVVANLAALDHADLVGGRLRIEEGAIAPGLAALNRRIERYWASVRALEEAIDPPPHDPAPRHGDHVAASLALRASLYRIVGGLPPLACGEDNALVAAVRRHGGRVRHCPAVSITVSARRAGRVTGGMATEMMRRQRVLDDGEAYLLPPASLWRAQIERRRAWRLAWGETGREQGREAVLLAAGLAQGDLAAIDLPGCPNAIAFVERIEERVGPIAAEPPPVPLEDALAGLDAMLEGLGASAAIPA